MEWLAFGVAIVLAFLLGWHFRVWLSPEEDHDKIWLDPEDWHDKKDKK